MANTLLRRALWAALLAFVVSIWCWVLVSLHGVWSFGMVEGYLDGGRMPLTPSFDVTYVQFFLYGLSSIVVTFPLALFWSSFAPQHFNLAGLLVCWLIGFWTGAESIAFAFQIDYGATWGPFEAFFELFFHPVVTPFALAFGLFGTNSLTGAIRRKLV